MQHADTADLNLIFQAGLKAADPFEATKAALQTLETQGRVMVIAAGKAAGRMAEAAESVYGKVQGLCVVPEGYERPLAQIETIIAAHPVPLEASQKAALQALEIAKSLNTHDTLICLMSGGGSALMSLPCAGLAFADKSSIIKQLLAKGARIQDLNTVRKSLSAIKGGRLAAATKAKVHTLVVSDVVGDDPSFIASGPTINAEQSLEEALHVLARYGVEIAPEIASLIKGNPLPKFLQGSVKIVVRPMDVLQATCQEASALGYAPLNLGDALEGDAFSLGQVLAGIGRSYLQHNKPITPMAIISGGETTAAVLKPGGKGGRNTSCALGFLFGAAGLPISGLFADTDGVDGLSGAAGAIVSRAMAQAAATDIPAILAAHQASDSASYFKSHHALLHTGPTGTNTNDLRIVLIGA